MTPALDESVRGKSAGDGSDRRHSYLWVLLPAAVVLYLFVAGFYVRHGLANADEGFYATAAHEVIQGRLPYRDFAYTQMPLLPYVQGAVMSVTGFGVLEQRWINVGWSAVALVLGVALCWRQGAGPFACAALVLVWCSCKQLVYFDSIGKTYALAQLGLLAAGACLFSRAAPLTRLLLFSLAAVFAVGCRLTVVPAVGVLWIGLATTLRPRVSWILLAGVPISVALILLGPFYASDPVNAFFWSWDYHLHSIYPTRRLHTLVNSFFTVPGVSALAAIGLVMFFRGRCARQPAAWVLFAGLIGWVTTLAAAGVYTDYAMPFLPLVIVGAACLWRQPGPTNPVVARWAGAALGAAIVFGLFQRDDLVQPGYLKAIDSTVAYVRAHTKPGDVTLTSMPEIPLQSGRPHFPGLELGKFGLTAEMDAKTAAARNVVFFPQLLETIDRQAVPMIVLCASPSWSFAWSVPSQRQFNQPSYQSFVQLLEKRYRCTYEDAFFKVWMIRD